MEMLLFEVFIQDLHGASNAVAAGNEGIDKSGRQGLERGLADKRPDNAGRLPTMYRKTETETFVFL
jgi:hypothetical protein